MTKKIIGFVSQPDYEGNSKALYEYIDKNFNDVKLIWFIHDYNNKDIIKSSKTEVICINQDNFLEKFQSCTYIFSTHNELLDFKTNEQIYIDLWHGVGLKKMGYLESINRQDFESHFNFYEQVADKVDFIVSPSEMNRIIFSSLYNINVLKTLEYGQPRYDYLQNSNGKEKLSTLTGRNDLDKFSKILIYLPTYKQGFGRIESNSSLGNILNLKSYDEQELINYLKEKNYYLVIKAHPFEEALQNFKQEDNIFYIKEDKMRENFISLNEILNATDLLITDYCSIYSDYVILEKPILFVHGDSDEYLKNRGLWFNNNLEFWFPGPRSLKLNDFKENLDKLICDTSYYKNERNMYNLLMNNNNRDVCKRLSDDIFNGKIENAFKFNNEVLNTNSLKKKNMELENKIRENETYIEEFSSKIKLLEKENEELNKTIKSIHNSNSWKLTQPFRNTKKIIKSINK